MIGLLLRCCRLSRTVAWQRKLLARQDTQLADLQHQVTTLRRTLAASPDSAKRTAAAFHDRCMELTTANAAMRCATCKATTGPILVPDLRSTK